MIIFYAAVVSLIHRVRGVGPSCELSELENLLVTSCDASDF
jgi:hypothetical protein